jgi:Cu(I)/Ag(I) efflux system membrane fusion protein
MNKKKFFILLIIISGVFSIVYYKRNIFHKQNSMQDSAIYYCPMHPDYTSNKPGSCPICGMDLVLKEKNEKLNSENKSSENNKTTNIKLSGEKKQMIGIKTVKSVYRNLEYEIKAPAYIAYDPDLYNALYEYKEALKIEENFKSSKSENIKDMSVSIIESARLKLKILGLNEEEIKKISESDFSNLIINQNSDYIWAYIDIYENDVPFIKIGDNVELTSKIYGDRVFKGVIKAIDSIIKPQTRTLRVRAIVENKDKLLKFQNYLEAKIKVKLGYKLVIPVDCILDSGDKKIVYVERESGIFEKRIIKTGVSDGEFIEVKQGLKSGELVVKEGNFMLDSEAKLKGI